MEAGEIRIGVDTGGTFTDVVLYSADPARLLTHKLLSTPDDPARAVLNGIAAVLVKWHAQVDGNAEDMADGGDDAAIDDAAQLRVVHGSTVATNALLEGKAAKAAYITTAGFEDVPWIGRQNRPELYALEPVKPVPPISRGAAIGMHERTRYDGTVLIPLADADIDALIERLRALNVSAAVVNLLHSYVNPAHERRIAARLREALPGLHLTVSSELLPEFREYERAATCIANAVVAPQMSAYVGRLARELPPGGLRVMASAGGSLPPEVVSREPVHTILSGPAGGVVGALNAARASGIDRIITFDMGGTSTDVSLCDGALSYTTESEIAGLPVRLPMIDIHTVGAGGGSLAWIDAGGALRVGPQSAGADPGPACYGLQQPPYEATVTDAHLVLGHLSADEPLGEGLKLDHGAGESAVARIAARAGLTPMQAAEGILRIAEATMARAIKRISVERGYDLREFALLPFGGAGGLHAARLADQLGIGEVVVPHYAGLLSALGMLTIAPLYTFSQAVMQTVAQEQAAELGNVPEVQAALSTLRERGEQALASEGIPADERHYDYSLDLRYAGQSFELTIPLDGNDPARTFSERHRQLYGYIAEDKTLVVVAARLRASGCESKIEHAAADARRRQPVEARDVQLHDGEREYKALRMPRAGLSPGNQLDGPLVVTEYSATTLVPRGWSMRVDDAGHLLLARADGGGAQ